MQDRAPDKESDRASTRGGDRASSAPAGPCLVVIHGPGIGRRFDLASARLELGRDEEADVPIPLGTVSRRHCAIDLRAGTAHIRDLGSTNGTFVEDALLESGEERTLRSGDRIRVGGAVVRYLDGEKVEELYYEEVHRTRIVDGLTGLSNRRSFAEFLERELARVRRHARPFALVRFDLDHLAALNDRFGRLTGDAALRHVAEVAGRPVRCESCLARVGGAEFALAMPETGLAAGRLVAERLRRAIGELDFWAAGQRIALTLSAGVAAASDDVDESLNLFTRAEARLVEARSAGGDRVVG